MRERREGEREGGGEGKREEEGMKKGGRDAERGKEGGREERNSKHVEWQEAPSHTPTCPMPCADCTDNDFLSTSLLAH